MIFAQRPPKFGSDTPLKICGVLDPIAAARAGPQGGGCFLAPNMGVHHWFTNIFTQESDFRQPKLGFNTNYGPKTTRMGNSIAQVGNGFYRCRRCPSASVRWPRWPHMFGQKLESLRHDHHAPQGSAWRLWRRCFC